MSEFIFKSPSVKFIEKDLTFSTPSLGITTLGLVGETQIGPAFVPKFITNKSEFASYFGNQSNEKLGSNLKYLLPFYANAYLNESNQLYVTRILGLSGYNAGTGWAVTISAGIDIKTTGITSSFNGVTNFNGGSLSGITITSTGAFGGNISYTKAGTVFSGTKIDLNVTTFDSVINSGTTNFTVTNISGTSISEYENMVVGVIRARGSYINNALVFNASAVTMTPVSSNTNIYGDFNITASDSTSEIYNVSLNPNKTNFITNVLGKNEKDKNAKIFVESIYGDLLKYLGDSGNGYGVTTTLTRLGGSSFSNYNSQYTPAETPYVVSELRGNKIQRLFKCVTIADGDAANKQIKVTIQRVDPNTGKFDIIVRDFNDTDDKVSIVESFTNCTMNPADNAFVGKRVGARTEGNTELDFPSKSKYIMLEMPSDFPTDAFPCGFEGYYLRNYSAINTLSTSAQTPSILYKTSYSSTDKVVRTYLGVSERAYDATTVGTGVNQNFFNYNGASLNATSLTKTKGFHFDSGATSTYVQGLTSIGQFYTGAGQFQTELDVVGTSVYSDIRSRKFTVVPAGGFDGWDIYRDSRTNNGNFTVGKLYYTTKNDYEAYKKGITSFINPEDTLINIFATPGINWYDHSKLVDDAIDMVERDRGGDAFYIIDAPDVATSAQDIAGMLDVTDIDSSYSGTYSPYIQINDSVSNAYLYIPPTGEVARIMALTDKLNFPWFAPAGISRGGITSAINVRKKYTEGDRDILQQSRINPITKFSESGIHVFGQKTLQKRDSALDRINVRRLMIYAKKIIRGIANGLLFDPNDDVIVGQFIGKVNPLLANIQRERGLYDFRVRLSSENTPETRDMNQLFFEISLKPTAALEELGITFIITPSSVVFND